MGFLGSFREQPTALQADLMVYLICLAFTSTNNLLVIYVQQCPSLPLVCTLQTLILPRLLG